jgi:hypothetical protein
MIKAVARSVLVTGAMLALLAPFAQAQTPPDLPVGEARGVRLVQGDGGALVLVFTPRSGKLRQRINSPYAWFSCTELGEPFVTSGGGNLDVPRRGRRVRTGFSIKGADYCRVFLRSHTVKRGDSRRRIPRRVLFSIPLTQAGAVFLDEEAKAIRLLNLGVLASLVEHQLKLPGYPTYAQLVEEYPSVAKVVVRLAAPDASPPPKRLGYYSDGQAHLVVAMLSASGKRLFIEEEPGEVLRTNVTRHIFGDPQP